MFCPPEPPKRPFATIGSNTHFVSKTLGVQLQKTTMCQPLGNLSIPICFIGWDTTLDRFKLKKAMPILANLGIPPVLHMTLLNINANLENVSITKCVPIHQYPANALPKPGLLQISSNFAYSYSTGAVFGIQSPNQKI